MNEERQREIDNIYRAIGRFVVEFSQLQHQMELAIRVTITQQVSPGPLAVVLAGREMQRVANDFFNILGELCGDAWSADDWAVVKSFRKEVDSLIQERNRIAHDAWFVGWGNEHTTVEEWATAQRMRYVSNKHESRVDGVALAATDLDSYSDRAGDLGNGVVLLMTLAALDGTPPSRNWTVVNGRPVRRHPPGAKEPREES